MVTRKGLYVGGREIIKRYVGKQLVWQKKENGGRKNERK